MTFLSFSNTVNDLFLCHLFVLVQGYKPNISQINKNRFVAKLFYPESRQNIFFLSYYPLITMVGALLLLQSLLNWPLTFVNPSHCSTAG